MHEKYAIASMSVVVGKVSSPIRPPGVAPLVKHSPYVRHCHLEEFNIKL